MESLPVLPAVRFTVCVRSSAFDAATLLDVAETTAFIKATQPMQWAKLSKQFAGEEDTALAGHLTP